MLSRFERIDASLLIERIHRRITAMREGQIGPENVMNVNGCSKPGTLHRWHFIYE